ncbi:hypothetical protein [Actinomyces oris]|uniref:hypothetical protein n=1 Tax=Actinomyces oris TaxID=544580 RepID=UPI00288A4A6E|nr:hypothetical protein [Actinomyces oris]
MTRHVVSAEEIMRRVKAFPGGDVRDSDIQAVKGKQPIDYVPSRRVGHDRSKAELVGEYIRYLTDIHDRRRDLLHIPRERRQAHILAEAERAAAMHLEEQI